MVRTDGRPTIAWSDSAEVVDRQLDGGSGSDILVDHCGSLVLLRPLTDGGSEFLTEHAPDDAQWLGRALAIEPRYLQGWIEAMIYLFIPFE